jgi:hypothetical protein
MVQADRDMYGIVLHGMVLGSYPILDDDLSLAGVADVDEERSRVGAVAQAALEGGH